MKDWRAGCDRDSMAALERRVRADLELSPGEPVLLATLGGLLLQRGDSDGAINLFIDAVRMTPDDCSIINDLGAAYLAVGRVSEAEEVLRSALEKGGGDDARFNLACCLQQMQRQEEACAVLGGIGAPDEGVWRLQADCLVELGRWEEAVQCCFRVLQLVPNDPDCLARLGGLLEQHWPPEENSRFWLGMVAFPEAPGIAYFFLGNALRSEGNIESACHAYEEAVKLEPGMAEAWNNLGAAFDKLGRSEAAIDAWKQAIHVGPGLLAPHTSLCTHLCSLNRLAEAEEAMALTLQVAPDNQAVRIVRAVLLMRQRHFSSAESVLREMLAREPGYKPAELLLGLILLSQGDFDLGWPYYEARWSSTDMAGDRLVLDTPRWAGEPLDGKRLFVYSEQGFGDSIQFVRYFLELRRRYPTVSLIGYMPTVLVELFEASLASPTVNILRRGAEIPDHDFHIPMLSLPWRCQTSLESIPSLIPYLRVPDANRIRWKTYFHDVGRPRVGLVWATSLSFAYRLSKTIDLAVLQPIFDNAAVTWVSLQFGPDRAVLDEPPWAGRFVDPMMEVKSFADTAAIIAELDLVISVDTAVAHLAGALGKPVWLLDRYESDWRWLAPREDSPWYPGVMRIFSQSRFGVWDDVIVRIRAELDRFADDYARSAINENAHRE